MICREVFKRLSNNNYYRYVFEINDCTMIAGYRDMLWCVLYVLNWYDFVEGKISKVYMIDVPIRVRKSCSNMFLIGNFKEKSVKKNVYIFHIDTGELDGFLDIGFEVWLREIYRVINWESIKNEVEEIYESNKYQRYGKVYVDTFYPQIDLKFYEKFISNNVDALLSPLKR